MTMRRKLRSEIICERALDDASEGSSARTRPLSYDEIMVKRKSKKELEGVSEEARETETVQRAEKVRNSDRQSRDTNGAAMKHSRDYVQEDSSRKKMEKRSRMEHVHIKSEIKENRDMESRSKHKIDNDARNATETKNERQHRMRRKEEEHSRDDARYNHESKHHRKSVAQDRYIESNGGACERENKRRDRSGDGDKYRIKDPVKKHDSGSRRHTEISERKDKTELSSTRHDESRSKRRRSRSKERTKDKTRRSNTSSPKAQRNTDHGHDQDELSSLLERDRTRRHSDVDRSKMSGDVSTSHHRRHGASSSGLGGYSPRKRKSEAAVKTPSPIRSPERKSAGWDLPPSGTDINISTAVPSGSQLVSQTKPLNMIELAAGFSVASSMGKPISAILSNSLSAFKQASVDSVQLTQATRPMRRLYIDNIPGSATEKEIMECFNTYLLSSGSNQIRGTRPCISCMIHKEKGQALVEFLTPEDASAALSLDGRYLSGSILNIRRPKDFVEVPSGSSEKSNAGREIISEVAISDYVKDSPQKIFVGGIAEGLSSEMIMEIVSAFGSLKAYRFEVNGELNEPCAFLEYADQSVTLKACAGLNGMKLGDRILTVAQVVPGTESVESSGSHPFYGIPEHVKPLLEMPTQVLKLSNVFDQKAFNLLSEIDLEEIVEDVRLECSRFGSVMSVNVVKGDNTRTVISEAKEVTCDIIPMQPSEEENHHLDVHSLEAYGGGNINGEPSTNSKDCDAVDGVEDYNELALPTSNSGIGGVTETSTVEDSKEAHKFPPQNCDKKTSDDTQDADDPRGNDSEKNHLAASVQESGVSSELKSSIENSRDDGTPCDEILSGLDTINDKLQEVVALPTDTGADKKVVDHESCDIGNVFEVGCVLVEFRRTEASCMAAHCLHGRVFDDRIVTVEYVPLKAYRERFLKGTYA